MLKELAKEIKAIKSTQKELREFGLVVGGVLLAISALLWWKHRPYLHLAIPAAVLMGTGLVSPQILLPLQKIWMGIAVVMGAFMSRVILGVVFFLVLTPLSVVSRLGGKKYLNLVFREPEAKSYWIRKEEKVDKSRYEKQY